MALREIKPDQVRLDQSPQQQQPASGLRELSPDEPLILDQDVKRTELAPRFQEPAYFPPQPETNNLSDLAYYQGGTRFLATMNEAGANAADYLAGAVDQGVAGVQGAYYNIVGAPEPDPNAETVLQEPQGNFVSNTLRDFADDEFRQANVRRGIMNASGATPSVAWEDVKGDWTNAPRFIAEQGVISAPEMGAAFVPVVGLPLVTASISENVMQERAINNGGDPRDFRSGEDYQAGVSAGLMSAALERAGVLGDVGQAMGGAATTATRMSQVPANMVRSGAGEAATEFLQENVELIGATYGTDEEITTDEMLNRGSAAALVGFGVGAGLRGSTDTVSVAANGFTRQDMGTDEQQQAVESSVPSRGDLEQALQSEETPIVQEQNQEVQQAVTPRNQVSLTKPVDYSTGDLIEHITPNGEVISGQVANIKDVNGERALSITMADGTFDTVFLNEGQTQILEKNSGSNRGVLETALQEEAAPLEQPKPPEPVQQNLIEPEPVVRTEQDVLRELDIVKQQAKQQGWNQRLMKRRDELNTEIESFKPPKKSYKDQLSEMSDQDVMEIYRGQNVRNKNLAKEELKKRYPDRDLSKSIDIEQATLDINTEPTEAQKEAGNYKKGHVSIQGLPITIENAKGSIRSGTDANGQSWQVTIPANYGYVKKTKGADGDHVDVYIGENPDSSQVYVVDQNDANTGAFDEHKVFIGFNSSSEALETYNAAFSDGRGSERMGGLTEFDMPQFKDWLENGNIKKPLTYRPPVKPTEQTSEPEQTATTEQPTAIAEEEKVVLGDFASQEATGKLSDEEQDGLTAVAIKYRDTVLNEGKADQTSGRIFEAYAVIDMLLGKNIEPDLVQSLRSKANNLAQRYGNNLYNSMKTPPSDAILKDANSLFKMIQDAHKKLDAADKKDGPKTDRTKTAEKNGVPDNLKRTSQKKSADDKDVESKPETKKPVRAKNAQTENEIGDFGEKILGARKDVWQTFQSSLNSELPEDLAKITLSKHFPEPAYEKLLNEGADVKALAAIKAMRDEIPNKPRATYRLKSWAEKVKVLRDFSSKLVDGEYTVDYIIERMRSENRMLAAFSDRIELYNDLGYPAFTKAKDWSIGVGSYSMYNGVEYKPAKRLWTVAKGRSFGKAFETREEALIGLRQSLLNEIDKPPESRKTKLDLFQNRATKKVYIGKKVAAGKVIKLKEGFDSVKEARVYLKENEGDLLKLLEKKKEIPSERRELNEARVGQDYRGETDATPEKFTDQFGFRGVQFGNWVENDRRQKDLNDAYDALMDMSNIIGIPTRAVSLEGTLGLAFGARGKGGIGAAKAHYEPGHVVINLTKKTGAGSLGHEWFHALDNYFGKQEGNTYITERFYMPKKVREEAAQAFGGVMKAIRSSGMKERSKNLDNTRTKDYWSTDIELAARAFEAYLIYKADQKGEVNDYLANIVSEESWLNLTDDKGSDYPYPTKKELKDSIAPAFDNLFDVLQTKEVGDDIAMYSLGNRAAQGLQSELLKATRALNQNKGTGEQILAMLRKSKGIKEEEISWTGLDDYLSGKKSVTKDEVVQYLEENQVRIEELTLTGEGNIDEIQIQNEYENLSNRISDEQPDDNLLSKYLESWYEEPNQQNWSKLSDRLDAFGIEHSDYEDLLTDSFSSETKYSQYTMPGGENYREVLLTLPTTPEEIRIGNKAAEFAKTLRDKYGERYASIASDEEMDKYEKLLDDQEAVAKRSEYKNSHFDQSNVLAHVRLNDRTTTDGKRVLFIEEIQSDWHQAGRKKGYKEDEIPDSYKDSLAIDATLGDRKKLLNNAKDDLKYFTKKVRQHFIDEYKNAGVDLEENPKAKFVVETESRWDDAGQYVLNSEQSKKDFESYKKAKSAVSLWEREINRIVAEYNANKVPDAPFKKNWHEMAFRRVAQMAAQQGYDAVAWTPGDVQNERYDLSKTVKAVYWQPNEGILTVEMPDGEYKQMASGIKEDVLEDYVGKDVAARIVKKEALDKEASVDELIVHSLKGDNLKIGGSGMKGFYDKILKNYADKFGKKYGSNVGTTNLGMIRAQDGISGEDVMLDLGRNPDEWSNLTNDQRRELIKKHREKQLEVWSLPITEQMQEAAQIGFELFSRTGAAVRAKNRKNLGKIESSLNKHLKKIGFDKADVRLFEDVLDTPLPYVDDSVEGAYWRGLVYLSLNSNDIIGTLNHEIVHALRAAGAFTSGEWSTLERQAKKWRDKYNIDETYGEFGLSESRLNEEAIAHAFQDYAQKGILVRLRNTITKFMAEIKNFLMGAPYGFNSHQQIFDAITRGDIAARTRSSSTDIEAQPLFSLSKKKKEALMQAREQLQHVRGIDNELRPSVGKVASYMLHPRQIASIHKAFTPVYDAAINMMKDRDLTVHDLTTYITPYNNLTDKDKKKVNAALELGRLSQTTFKPVNGRIEIKNTKYDDAVHTSVGETVVLDEGLVGAYEGVRQAMNTALDKYIETILVERGLDGLGIKTKADLSKRISSETDTTVLSMMYEALKIIRDVEQAKKAGYVSLKRWGDVAIAVRSKTKIDEETNRPQLMHFERIELPQLKHLRAAKIADNKAVQEALKKVNEKYPKDQYNIDLFEMKDYGILQSKFDIKELDVLAASSDMQKEDYDTLRTMISEAMAKRGFRAHFFQANDVPGYSGDFERAINDYIVSISGYLARRTHQGTIDDRIEAIEEGSIRDYSIEYADYIMDPQEEFAVIRQAGFMMYLAGNLASGLTNATQPFMVTAPWFKGMFTHAQIAGNMSKAYAEALQMVSKKAGKEVFDPAKAPEDIKSGVERAVAEGLVLPLETFQAMAIARTQTAHMRGFNRRARDIMDMISLTFSIPERANRLVTFMSAYRLALDPKNKPAIMSFVGRDQLARSELFGKDGEDFAYAFAEYAVFSTQYHMGKLNRPKIGRKVGTLPFQFLSHLMQTLELSYRLARLNEGKSKAALGMMLFAVFAMAGYKGFPGEDDVEELIESAWSMVGRTDLDIDAEMRKMLSAKLGVTMTDLLMKGVPYALFDVDMSNRLGYGNIIPDSQEDMLGIWYDMIFNNPASAGVDIARGDPLAAASDIFPRFIANMLEAYGWSQHGVRSATTGKTIIAKEDLTDWDIAIKALGFTSANVSKRRDFIYMERRASNAVNELRTDYYTILARDIAMRERMRGQDQEAFERYQQKIDTTLQNISDYNETVPVYKRVIIQPYSLKKRVKQEMVGSDANKPRKQARSESEVLRQSFGLNRKE